jgi:hypothetical protein
MMLHEGERDSFSREVSILTAQLADAHAQYLEERMELARSLNDERITLESFVQKVIGVMEQRRRVRALRGQLRRMGVLGNSAGRAPDRSADTFSP